MTTQSGGPDRKPAGWKTGGIIVAINLVFVFACAYIVARVIWESRSLHSLDAGAVLSVALLLTEAFVVFQSLAYALDFSSALRATEPPAADIGDWNAAPKVAILMPARHEPYAVLENTLLCLRNLDYPNKEIGRQSATNFRHVRRPSG